MKLNKFILGIGLFASTVLATACTNRVNIKENYDQSEIQKVCVVSRYKITGRAGFQALDNLILKSFSNLSIPTKQVETVEEARKSDCTHYLGYYANFKHTFAPKTTYKFYKVNHNSLTFFSLANITLKEKIYFDGSHNAQAILDKVVHTLLTGDESAQF